MCVQWNLFRVIETDQTRTIYMLHIGRICKVFQNNDIIGLIVEIRHFSWSQILIFLQVTTMDTWSKSLHQHGNSFFASTSQFIQALSFLSPPTSDASPPYLKVGVRLWWFVLHRFHSCLILYLARSTEMFPSDPLCREFAVITARRTHLGRVETALDSVLRGYVNIRAFRDIFRTILNIMQVIYWQLGRFLRTANSQLLCVL